MLTLQFIPYYELQGLNENQRITKILRHVREDKIVLVEGRLDSEEEALLIQRTMEEINRSFKGVEICSINQDANNDLIKRIRIALARFLMGSKGGFTIIGPASIVREIRKDPNKIELLTGALNKRRRRK